MTMSSAETLNSETWGATLMSRISALFMFARTKKTTITEIARTDVDATFRPVVTGFAHLG